MKHTNQLLLFVLSILVFSCDTVDTTDIEDVTDTSRSLSRPVTFASNFQFKSTITVGGEGAAEITAFDKLTSKLFVTNAELDIISVVQISKSGSLKTVGTIDLPFGAPNSVSVSQGKLAVAVEANSKQDNGSILVYDTDTYALLNSYEVGALPDMVAFSPNGKFLVSANEGEPDDNYAVDPKGSISIIKVKTGEVSTLYFDAFNGMEATLESQGFRVFGPNANLAMDVEPEYVAVSDNSRYAWVTLQENNGVAKVNLESATIEAILPLGFKDYSLPGNEIDPSNRDDGFFLNNWPVFGTYMPDAIAYLKFRGNDYFITANEGDAREYEGDISEFIEEERIGDIELDEDAFSGYDIESLQENENLGRLKITTTLGDTDGDGDFDELYSFGARSFTIWSGDGALVYDSGNDIALQTIDTDRFNGYECEDDDGEIVCADDRSDDKGAEPESVTVLKTKGRQNLLFVGLERNDQILVYDITNPFSPQFVQLISNYPADQAPEGLLAIPAHESPTNKDLLVVSNEDSGTVTVYQNN